MIWILVAICLFVSFVFSGIEAGILSVNRVRLAHYAKLKAPGAVRLSRLLQHPERLLVSVLIVTNLMNVFAVVMTTNEIVRAFSSVSSGRIAWEAYLIAFAICLPIYLFAFNLLPKAVFRRFPYRALAVCSNALRITDVVLSPLLMIFERINRAGAKEKPEAPRKLFVAREEFKYFTIEGERVGTLTTLERDMIHNIVDFRAVTARDVMIPMENVRTIGEDESVERLIELGRKHDIDRFPVLSDNGRVVGLVTVFDVLLDRREDTNVRVYTRRIVSATPTDQAYTVIRKLRSAHITLAVVLDERGIAIGIVSAEDLVRRLVSAALPSGETR